MADNALTRLPLAGQFGVSLLAAAAIGGAFYYFSWSGMVEEEDAKSKKLSGLKQEITRLEVTAQKLQDFQREVQLREARLERLKLILPPEKETPELIRKVQYLATQSSLKIRTFDPQATVTKAFPTGNPAPAGAAGRPAPQPSPGSTEDAYQEWPINVEVEGSFHELGMFFDRVGRLARLVNVSNIKVKPQTLQKVSQTIAASCTATTFVYVEASPAPPGAPGAKK